MSKNRDFDYEAAYRNFRHDVPSTFNFAADVVDRYAEDPDKLALIWCNERGDERRFTYAEIAGCANRLGNFLREREVTKGDRVLVMLPRWPEWQIAMLACLKLGAVPIPSITMLTPKDVDYRLTHSGAVAAITTAESAHKVPAGPRFKALVCVDGTPPDWHSWEEAQARSDVLDAEHVDAEDPAVLYYTSGSTGNPKGVMHAARGLYAWRVSAQYWLRLNEDDLIWCTADTGWSKAGTSILFGPWSCGSAVLFYDGPFDAAKRLELLQTYRVSVFCAAATELRRLILEPVSDYDLEALNMTVSAGESVNPEVLNSWTSLTGAPLLDAYGQTETLMTVLNYPGLPVRPGSMGRALPGVEIALRDDNGTLASRSAEGELLIKLPNPQVMLGYWQDPDLTNKSTVVLDGSQRFYCTGDKVRIDADGYCFYQGRTDDIINSAGYRIGPQEVENALMEHPAVQECAVVGEPDPERGEVVKACIVLQQGTLASGELVKALQQHVKQSTAPYKYPRRIEFVDELPKTVSGKIRRRLLRSG